MLNNMPTRQCIHEFIKTQCTLTREGSEPTIPFRDALRMWAPGRGYMPPTNRLISTVLKETYDIEATGARRDWWYRGIKVNPQQCRCGETVNPTDKNDVRNHIHRHGGLRWKR